MGRGGCVSILPLLPVCPVDHQAIPHSQSSPLCHQRSIAGAFQVARSTSAMAMASTQPRVVMRRKPLPSQGHFSPEPCSQRVPFGMVRSSTELPQSLQQLPSQDSLISTGGPETSCLQSWLLWCVCNQEYHHTHTLCVMVFVITCLSHQCCWAPCSSLYRAPLESCRYVPIFTLIFFVSFLSSLTS